jgi:S-formylglutathione hydrolase FrmB
MTIALLFFALLVRMPGCNAVGTEQILDCTNAGERFAVVLPESFTTDRKWPAILMMHGAGRNHMTLIDNPGTRESLQASKSVVILPDGGLGWWRDEARVLSVLDWLSPRLNLDPHRIGCAGWSMGGYGSLRMVTGHPDRFSAWGGMIGLVDYPNPKYPRAENYPVSPVFGTPDQWAAANPINDVDRLRGKAIWFATADQSFDAAMNRELDRVLRGKQFPHTFEVIQGNHDFAAVSQLLPMLLRFLEHSLQ